MYEDDPVKIAKKYHISYDDAYEYVEHNKAAETQEQKSDPAPERKKFIDEMTEDDIKKAEDLVDKGVATYRGACFSLGFGPREAPTLSGEEPVKRGIELARQVLHDLNNTDNRPKE